MKVKNWKEADQAVIDFAKGRRILPRAVVKLAFVTNKWNDNLSSAQIDGRTVADITYYPSQGLTVGGDGGARGNYHLYTSMPSVIDEGFYFSRQSAESRANWRANIR